MNPDLVKTTFAALAAMFICVCVLQGRLAESSSAGSPQTAAKPLLLEKNEGERRIWRDLPPGDFILKVSQRTMVPSA